MGQRAPTGSQIAIAVAFAFSCFGLLLFLWNAFGGPVPFAPQGYRIKVPVDEAAQLAVESDVRIASVSVGKVKKVELEDEGENRDLALATIEIDDPYAPLPEDTRAILRQKTLLGETYMELTQGNGDAPTIPEGGTLPHAQVSEAVQLDEIFRAFDERTRDAFKIWMQSSAIATAGRGADLSAAIANLEPFAEDANRLLRVLDTQDEAVSRLVKNTGVVFNALSERQGQLRGLIQNSATVFDTTAQRDEDLREAFRALPTFLDESRLTLQRLESFAANANPLITQLRPSAPELSGTLRQVARVTPDLKGFFVGFRRLARNSKKGLPALRALLSIDLPPLLTQFNPFLRQVTPIIATAARYRREVTSFLGNITGATQAGGANPATGNVPVKYLRVVNPFVPEAFAVYTPNRLQSNRSNAFEVPGWMDSLATGLPGFETRQCAGGQNVTLNPATPLDPNFIPRANPDLGSTPADLFARIQQFGFGGANSTTGVPRPACTQQPQVQSIGEISELTDYLHVYQDNP